MRTAACLYVRDEARNVAEWAAFHLEAGFDHLFVYDNRSVDGTGEVAAAFGRSGATVIPWRFEDAHAQYKAYDHCLARAAGAFDWVACIDVDEFLVFQPGWDLQRCLTDRTGCDAVAVHWAFFGSGGHEDYPPGLIVEAFTRRAEAGFGPNRHVKSIVRPGRCGLAVSPHSFATPNYQLAGGQPVQWQSTGITATPADYTVCQLNHYFVRSRAHWRDKMKRGYRDGTRDDADFGRYDLNEVEDRLACRLAPRVRLRIDQALGRRGDGQRAPWEATLLDQAWYLMRYPDVAASGLSAFDHFWTFGLNEERDPNPFFDAGWYARTYLRPRGFKGPGFLHFLSEGAHAGLPARG